jgi:hypothetical protein
MALTKRVNAGQHAFLAIHVAASRVHGEPGCRPTTGLVGFATASTSSRWGRSPASFTAPSCGCMSPCEESKREPKSMAKRVIQPLAHSTFAPNGKA